MTDYGRSKLLDLIAAVLLIAWWGWGVWRQWPLLLDAASRAREGRDPLALASMLAYGGAILFSAFLIVLLLARIPPSAKSSGLVPRLAGLAGTFAVFAFFQLPPAPYSATASLVAMLLLSGSFAASILVLAWLGTSFSILPEARRLVTTGPYALVRHPLYLAEEFAVVAYVLLYAQPWAILLFFAHLAIQIARMHFEERILAAQFPDYAAYAARTRRLLPGVY